MRISKTEPERTVTVPAPQRITEEPAEEPKTVPTPIQIPLPERKKAA